MEGFKLRAINSHHQYEHPSMSAPYRIYAFAESFSPQSATSYSTQGILHKLNMCQTAADGILRSVDTGRPYDAGKKAIDKITQREELLLISNSLDKIHTIVSKHLTKDTVECYWTNSISLSEPCARLGVVVGQMRARAIIVEARIAEEKATIVANLLTRTDIAPDCLGIIGEYLLT